MGYMEALGRLYDLSVGFGITDGLSGKITGKRVSTKHASGLSAVLIKAADNSAADPVLTISYTTAATGGSLTPWPLPPGTQPLVSTGGGLPAVSGSQVLAATPQWYYKKAAGFVSGSTGGLTGGETWTRVYASPNASGVMTLTGEGTNAGIYVIPLNPTDPVTGIGTSAGGLPAYVEIDVGSLAHTQYMALLYILHDLEVQQDPTRMFSSQT